MTTLDVATVGSRWLPRQLARQLARPAVTFVVALGLAACANFGFHAVISRVLPNAEYGVVTALLALLMAIAVPAAALEVNVTREVAAMAGAPVSTARLLRTVTLGGTLAGIALLGLSPLLGYGLHLQGVAIPLLLAAYVPVMLAGHISRGVLLGGHRYRPAAMVALVGALVRLIAGGLGAATFGAIGALSATLAAEAAMGVVGWIFARRQLDAGGPVLRVGWGAGGLGVTALVGFWLLVGLDTVLARALLSAQEAAFYSAAATLGRAALFAPMALVTVAYTRFAADPPAARATMRHWLGLVCLAGLGAVGVLAVDPQAITVLALGTSFAAAAALVVPLAVVAVGLGVIGLFVHFHLAACRRTALLPWLGVVLASAGAVAWHESPAQLASVLAAAVGATVIAGAATLPRRSETTRPHGERHMFPVLGGEAQVDVTVVVPFYNPGPELGTNMRGLAEQLARTGVTYEIIAVSDGSTDGSARTLEALLPGTVELIELPHNQGKGAAVRTGLARGRGRYLGFIDADGDLDPALWSPFITLMNLYEPDLVMGSKRHPLSDLEYPPLRRLYSWGFQQLTRVLFRLNIRDTQTGIKLIRRDVLAQVLPLMLEQRFTFDLELLVIARHLGFGRFFEAPVRVRHQFTSTVSVRSVVQMLRDTIRIFGRLRFTGRYTPPTSDVMVTSLRSAPAAYAKAS